MGGGAGRGQPRERERRRLSHAELCAEGGLYWQELYTTALFGHGFNSEWWKATGVEPCDNRP